jgi:hypothetical protein
VLRHDVAGLLEGGVEDEPEQRLAQELRQHGVASLQRRPPQVLAIKLDEAEAHSVTNRSRRRLRSSSNDASPSCSNAIASPSIRQERTRRASTASAMSGKRYVQSCPLRVE